MKVTLTGTLCQISREIETDQGRDSNPHTSPRGNYLRQDGAESNGWQFRCKVLFLRFRLLFLRRAVF